MKKCQANYYCKLYETEKCNELCGMYNLLKAIYSLSGIPLKYQYKIDLYPGKQDRPTFMKLKEYMDNVVENVEQGKGLYIWSLTTGNGKTTWATKIANQYIRKTVAQQRLANIVTYINVPTYLERVRQSYNEKDEGLVEVNNQVLESDLVIFDDIGAEKPTEWVREQLYRIINHRDNNLKTNIFTSNVNPEDVKENLGVRNYSRIVVANEVIEIKGSDFR